MGKVLEFIPDDMDVPWKQDFSDRCGHCKCYAWLKLIQVFPWNREPEQASAVPWARREWVKNDEKKDGDWRHDEDLEDETTSEVAYSVYQCVNCAELTFIRWSRVEGQTWLSAEKVYPSDEEPYFRLFPGGPRIMLPTDISDAYYQAKAVEDFSPTAFTLMTRRALEAICRDRGATKGTLAQKLYSLIEIGELPKKLGEFSEIIRLLGNISAHDADVEIPPEMAKAIDSFFQAIVEYVYIAPARIRVITKALERLKASDGQQA